MMEDEPIIEEPEEANGSRPESLAPGVEQELLFSKSASMTKSEDSDTIEKDRTNSDIIEKNRTDSDIIERARTDSSIEYLMTAQEIQELDKRLEDVIDNLQQQREDYERWENSLNKRRLEAFGRLKALGKFHRQRMEIYDTVKDYLQTMSHGSQSRKNTTKK